MNKPFLIVLIVFFIEAICQEYSQTHKKCNHDDQEFQDIPPDVIEKIFQRQSKRKLVTTDPQPIRITFDYDQLKNTTNGDGMTELKINYIKKLTNSAAFYLKNLIKTIPRTVPIKTVQNKISCGSSNATLLYPDYLKASGSGIIDSDIHFLITYTVDPSSSALADSLICEYDPNPIVGKIKFNIDKVNLDSITNKSFQDYFSLTLHEITHALGFSGNGMKYWIDPETNKYYDTNVSKIVQKVTYLNVTGSTKLMSKNVVRTAKQYFLCPQIDGMMLENQGNSSSLGSHWERDLIKNEYMTSSLDITKFSISEFTAALLRDTGYYAEINSNLLDSIYWGYQKGCDFFYSTCSSTTEFPEYPLTDEQRCDYYGIGYGPVTKTDSFSQCKKVNPYTNRFCYDDIQFTPSENYRQNTGTNSKCFQSTALLKGFTSTVTNYQYQKCFKIECNQNNSSIKVYTWNTEYVTCNKPNQVIDLSTSTATTVGTLKCPGDFYQFCNFPKFCKNFCSQNGICINGQCKCFDGYAGEDCSVSCSSPNKVYDGTQCTQSCPINTFKNPDNTCKSTCPFGYYGNSSTQECLICHRFCQTCTGPSSIECQSCNIGYELNGTSCILYDCDSSCGTCYGSGPKKCTSCYDFYYLDSLNQCQKCTTNNCIKCGKDLICQKCQDAYALDATNNKCLPICDSTCLSCSSPLNPKSCTSCRDGMYLSSGQCLNCDFGCVKCTLNQSNCSSCIFGYVLYGTICKSTCFATCKTCTLSNNSKACTTCKDGYYLQDKECFYCPSPCKNCTLNNKIIQCTSCVSDYSFDSINHTCTPICHPNCIQCTLPNQNNSCTSCQVGFYLKDSSCFPCKSPCLTCSSQDTQCTSCLNTTDYSYDSINNKCNLICHNSCLACNKPNDSTSCSQCKEGYYLEGTNCNLCKSPCKFCTLEQNNLICLPCSSDKYYDSSKDQCISCLSPCKTCQSAANQCLSCVNSLEYTYDGNKNKCNPICHASCKSCSSPNDIKKCTSCKDGYYLDGTTCKECSYPCSKCVSNSNNCTSCESEYQLNDKNICIPKCDISCETCSQPRDRYSCLDCAKGFIKIGNECKRCKYPCLECQNDQQQCTKCFASYALQGTKCMPSCHYSCVDCSEQLNESKCTVCNPGFYLENKSIGKCLQCQFPCKTCLNADKCLTCVEQYQIGQNYTCQPICHSTCKSCVKPYDKTSCIICRDNFIIKTSNKVVTCEECPIGKYVNNGECSSCTDNCKKCTNQKVCDICTEGYYLNEAQQCTKDKACHFTCKECLDYTYSTCVSCSENRVLKVLNNQSQYGICECPDDTSDFNQQFCDKSKVQSNFKSSLTTFFSASIATTTMFGILSNNPLFIMFLLEFCQNISYMKYMNQYLSIGFDDAIGVMSYSQFTKFIEVDKRIENDNSQQQNNRILLEDEFKKQMNQYEENQENNLISNVDQIKESERQLQLLTGKEIKKENIKLRLSKKSDYFIYNTIALYIIQGIGWILAIVVAIIANYYKTEVINRINRILNISLPIILFYFCSEEQWLLIFYQLSNFSMDSDNLSLLSFLFAILTLIYMLLFMIYLFYKLEYKKVILNAETTLKDNLKKSQLVIDLDQTDELDKYYLLHMAIRQNNFMTRNFVQIMVIIKAIIGCVTSSITNSAFGQVFLIIICYFIIVLYIGCFQPFKQQEINISLGGLYLVIGVIYILYFLTIEFEDSPSSSKVLIIFILISVLIVLALFLIYSITQIVAFIYRNIRKLSPKRRVQANNPMQRLQQREESLTIQVHDQTNNVPQKQGDFVQLYSARSSFNNTIKQQEY